MIIGTFKKSDQKKSGATFLSIFLGIISVVAGIFSMGHPFLTMVFVGYIIAANVMIQGISVVVIACSAKKADAE